MGPEGIVRSKKTISQVQQGSLKRQLDIDVLYHSQEGIISKAAKNNWSNATDYLEEEKLAIQKVSIA